VLLSEAVDGYLLFKSSRASPNTIETDRYVLGAFLGWLGDDVTVDAVDAAAVRAYLAHEQARGLAPSTVVRTHATISALFVWLADSEVGLAAANPARAVNPPRIPKLRPRALTAEQVTALVAACGETTLPRRDRAVVLFLLDTGARASELAGVTDRDVDLKTGKVRVMGKGAKERFVYLGKRTLSVLWLYVHDERPEHAQANDEHLFLTQDGYPMTRYTVGSLIARVGAGGLPRAPAPAPPHGGHRAAAERDGPDQPPADAGPRDAGGDAGVPDGAERRGRGAGSQEE
jgi:site-specific recombinase XerD